MGFIFELKWRILSHRGKKIEPSPSECGILDAICEDGSSRHQKKYLSSGDKIAFDFIGNSTRTAEFVSRYKPDMSVENFHLDRTIGKGSFARVVLVRSKDDNNIYAMKVLDKKHVSDRKQIGNVLQEKKLLSSLSHNFIVKLHSSFQTISKLFIVIEFCPGGELLFHLQKRGKFSMSDALVYASELICCISYLHSKATVFRDLKPENILLDKNGHVKLTDFGLCKVGVTSWLSGASTSCGTPQYMAPEVFLTQDYGFSCDWWSIGIVFYELVVGLPPFRGRSPRDVFESIINLPLVLVKNWPDVLKDFIKKLLSKRAEIRLGGNGQAAEVKAHDIFKDTDFDAVERLEVPAPVVPNPVAIGTVESLPDAAEQALLHKKFQQRYSSSTQIGTAPSSQVIGANPSASASAGAGAGADAGQLENANECEESELVLNVDPTRCGSKVGKADEFESIYQSARKTKELQERQLERLAASASIAASSDRITNVEALRGSSRLALRPIFSMSPRNRTYLAGSSKQERKVELGLGQGLGQGQGLGLKHLQEQQIEADMEDKVDKLAVIEGFDYIQPKIEPKLAKEGKE